MGSIRICNVNGDCVEAVEGSWFGHRPSVIASVVFAAVAGLAFIANVAIVAVKRKRVWFVVYFAVACALSVAGWVFRVIDVDGGAWAQRQWRLSITFLSIAPVFVNFSIYLVLRPLFEAMGAEHSVIRPKLYPMILVPLESAAFILQAAGHAVAFNGLRHIVKNANSQTRNGSILVMAAHCAQAAGLVTTLVLLLLAAMRASAASRKNGLATHKPLSRGFVLCVAGIVVSCAVLCGRRGDRIALLGQGFHGPLARNQTMLIALDGAPVAAAILLLALLHPAIFIGSARRSYGAGAGAGAGAMGAQSRGGFFGGGKNGFSKLEDGAEDSVPLNDQRQRGGLQDNNGPDEVSEVYLDHRDVSRGNSPLPTGSAIHQPPPSFDPMPYEPAKFEPMRHEKPGRPSSGDLGTQQPYYDGPASRSQSPGPQPYSSGGI